MKTLPFSLLSLGELYTLTRRITKIIEEALLENPYLASLISLLNISTDDLARALGKALTSEYTSVLFKKDELRDRAFLGLRHFILSYTFTSDPVKLAAALPLETIIEDVGTTIYRLGYVLETAKLNALFKRLNETDAQQNITTLGAQDWLTQLTTAQEDFEKTYREKADAEAAINFPLAKDSKARIVESLDSILNFIDSNAKLDAAGFKAVNDKIEEAITEVVAIARARKTRDANASKQTPEK